MIKKTFHGVPIGDDACSHLESVLDLAAGCCVCVGIIPNIRDRSVELPVPVTSYIGWIG